MKLTGHRLNNIAWLLSVVVSTAAVFVWGQGFGWQPDRLSSYRLFPLFGLLAFSLMWGHYVISALRRQSGIEAEAVKDYFKATSWLVLLFIFLHPGLLVWQLWRDGFGLPPGSYLDNYVAAGLGWAAFLGTVSLLMFLAYELHRWFSSKRWWRLVEYASDAGMILILIHSLKLGRHLQAGWFRSVWIFYGVTYLVALVYIRLGKPGVR